jgi:hypothetical protein
MERGPIAAESAALRPGGQIARGGETRRRERLTVAGAQAPNQPPRMPGAARIGWSSCPCSSPRGWIRAGGRDKQTRTRRLAHDEAPPPPPALSLLLFSLLSLRPSLSLNTQHSKQSRRPPGARNTHTQSIAAIRHRPRTRRTRSARRQQIERGPPPQKASSSCLSLSLRARAQPPPLLESPGRRHGRHGDRRKVSSSDRPWGHRGRFCACEKGAAGPRRDRLTWRRPGHTP